MKYLFATLFVAASLLAVEGAGAQTVRGAAAASPLPPTSESRSFRSWTIGCDNIRSCQALSVSSQDGDGGTDGFVIQVERPAGPRGQAVIRLIPTMIMDEELPAGIQLQIGREAPFALLPDRENRVWTLPDASVNRFMASARPAGEALVIASDGAQLATVPLSGLVATLRHMDAVQGRTGTVTALIDKGTVPAARVPAAPPLPQPALVPFRSRPTGAVPRAVRSAQTASCSESYDRASREVFTAYDLGRGQTLWEIACGLGAYNTVTLLVMTDAGGRVTPVMPLAGSTAEPTDALWINLSVDPATGVVSQFAKGRGLGDCGTSEAIGWTGTQFVPLRQATMDSCAGIMPDFWPVLYQSSWSR